MKATKNKTSFVIVLIVIVIAVAGAVAWALSTRHQYKDVISYSDGSYFYQCSKPVKAKLQKSVNAGNGGSGSYIPVNQTDAMKYCSQAGTF